MAKLDDRVAIVTGGAKGMGREMCIAFAKEGAKVIIADIDENAAINTAKEIETNKGKALAMQMDVTSEGQVNKSVQNVIDQFGKIDILVNHAGGPYGAGRKYIRGILLRDLSYLDWQAVINTNLTGTFLCCRAVLKYMMQKKSGVIINITSNHGIRGRAGTAAYSASKFGVEGLTQALAREVVPFNIRVNALKPGGLTASSSAQSVHPDIPSYKMIQPEVIRAVAVYLASDDSVGVTAQSLIAIEWHQDQDDVKEALKR